MRVFKTRLFSKWAKKEKLNEKLLETAVFEMEQGLIDADLGGHVFKKRIALQGRGKRGGARTIIAYKAFDRAFFLFGYPKKEKDNIDNEELVVLRVTGNEFLNHSDAEITHLVNIKELLEVKYEKHDD